MIANDSNFVYNLRREVLYKLVQDGHAVTVICQALAHKDELEELGCRVIDLNTPRHGKNPFADAALFIRYFHILKDIRPHVVFTNNIKPNVYAGIACSLLGIPYISNITGLGTPVEHPGLMQVLTTRLYKLGVGRAECIFFQNWENMQFFEKRKMIGRKTRTRLLPGSGVNLQTFLLQPYPEDEPIHFLFAARIMQEKGIDQFLAAARRFHSEKVVFDVCGMCDDEMYLMVLKDAHEAGVIIYHGQQKDMRPFYKQSHCFLYPSYYPEGMSNVLLEAAASGRPVIAADRSGCRETVENGVSGYVVPIKDEGAVIHAVEKFLSLSWEERRQMGIAGREKMEKEFDRRIVVEQYLQELEAIAR